MFSPDQARAKALEAALWLISQEDDLTRFLGASGASGDDLRQGLLAQEVALLGAVMDFILGEDRMVLACAGHLGIKPDSLIALRRSLPDGEVPDWT